MKAINFEKGLWWINNKDSDWKLLQLLKHPGYKVSTVEERKVL